MDIKNFIKTQEKPQDEVLNLMTSYLEDNRGFATEVCALLDEYFYDWAEELVDFDEEYVDEVGEDTESVCYEVDKDGDILKTTYFIVDDAYDVIIDRSEEWGYILSNIADKDDYHYSLYYRMVDWDKPYVRNSVSLIINEYMMHRLGI